MISWFIEPDLTVASYRYRVMIPMRELKRMGVEVSAGTRLGNANTLVFAKHFNPQEPAIAAALKQAGGRVIFDCCDDHFGRKHDAHYRTMIDLADTVTCPTEMMAERIFEETGKASVVIPDPYEYPRVMPQIRDTKRLLWFGHHTNMEPLARELPNLKGYDLLTVSDVPIEGVPHVKWTREAMLHAFSWCDAVILPTGDEPRWACKSPNRMVESIRQGKYVIANDLPSWNGYGMWQGSIAEGLLWFESHREEALQAVYDAQKIVEERHAPSVVAQQWAEVFESQGLMTEEEMQREMA